MVAGARFERTENRREASLRIIDFSSWQGLLATLIGLALFTLIGVGIRLLMMFTIQQRRERMNRQINERLRTLIAAYKVLGGSFTGDLSVDPAHLGELRRRSESAEGEAETTSDVAGERAAGSDRRRRIRDAVEAALSDVILLGTEEHVRLAEHAARALVAGQPVHMHDLVISLRDFIRKALDLDPIPADLQIPLQGPTRPSGPGGAGRERGKEGSRQGGGGQGGGGQGGGTGQGWGPEKSGDVEDVSTAGHRP
ncbi:putative membrane protein YgcG [Rhodoligotrophos appendicifer]|uniref:hypothetical protein n=1 Tax=Rhodoligotrophos appendicifer TaxID=987056 RepID=UPI001961DDD6|nr:hypothetical protein [Rhodoligotrophos appendicifer]